MKASIYFFALLCLLCGSSVLNGQNAFAGEKFTVVNVDVVGMDIDPKLAGEMVRRELMKLNLYNVADGYDQGYILEKENISIDGCYSIYCLEQVGKAFKVDKILTGSITKFNKEIVVTLKIYDVSNNSWEKMGTESFNEVHDQINMMIAFTLKKLLGLPYDEDMYTRLTVDKSFYDNIDLMNRQEAKLSGPRFGVGYLMGDFGAVMKAPKSQGGLDAYPMISHLGYQFEKVFISSGQTHALVEFIPILSGFEHNTIIPSLNLLLGVRNSHTGWELALGYNAALSKVRTNDEENIPEEEIRYSTELATGLIFAIGKTFKSGRLNFPVNAYFIPGRNNSHRLGLTFGFNIPRSK
jgi:hypothetical protein